MGGEAVGGEAVGGEAVGGKAVGGEAVGGEAVGGEALSGEAADLVMSWKLANEFVRTSFLILAVKFGMIVLAMCAM